jgi:hypothetical protein
MRRSPRLGFHGYASAFLGGGEFGVGQFGHDRIITVRPGMQNSCAASNAGAFKPLVPARSRRHIARGGEPSGPPRTPPLRGRGKGQPEQAVSGRFPR